MPNAPTCSLWPQFLTGAVREDRSIKGSHTCDIHNWQRVRPSSELGTHALDDLKVGRTEKVRGWMW